MGLLTFWIGLSAVPLLLAVWRGYARRPRVDRAAREVPPLPLPAPPLPRAACVQRDTGSAGVGSASGALRAAAPRPGVPGGRSHISCSTCRHMYTSQDHAPCLECSRFQAWEIATARGEVVPGAPTHWCERCDTYYFEGDVPSRCDNCSGTPVPVARAKGPSA